MNVIYLEADPMNRRVIGDMLDVAGATMTEAVNGELGLKLIGERDFDLALIDLHLPGMDGMTAIKQIRARGDARAKIPIIVLTADTAPGLRERCIAAGADEVLSKPVAMDALFEVMGRMLAGGEGDVTL